jgi:Protein of unknown function (DUF4231)
MNEVSRGSRPLRVLLALIVAAALIGGTWWCCEHRESWQRGEALGFAMQTVMNGPGQDQKLVAQIILKSYDETRSNAARWSGIYWGFTFFAAIFSALAALVLKVETLLRNEGAKKDIAALLSVAAALFVTVSTSGDFQRKWQANRVAAAELERTGYSFLENNGAEPRTYLASVGDILLRRQLAIAGSAEKAGPKRP